MDCPSLSARISLPSATTLGVMSSTTGQSFEGTATECAREGAKVVICTAEAFQDQLLQAQANIERETGNRPYAFLCDVNDGASIQALVDKVIAEVGDIYALANMCPGPKPGPFTSFDDTAWEKAFNMCLLSYVRTIRACLPSMKRLGGGRMSKTLAREVGKDNILVNVIGPGRIGTARIESLNRMRAEKAGVSPEEYEKLDLKSFPMGRYGTTEEYGKLACFLLSAANTYISGQVILLDGAMTQAY